jgi:uncharacterized RDD family membrane protein YckC
MTQPPPGPPPEAAPPPGPPPQAAATQGASGPRANFGQRLVAYIIDVILLAIPYAIGYAIFDPTIAYLLSLVIGIGYFGYFEGSASGQTVGKKVMKIRVIDFNSGAPIGFGRALIRYVARIVSSIPCALGYFWMLWDKEKQTWHDKLATTAVVPESAYPVTSWPG